MKTTFLIAVLLVFSSVKLTAEIWGPTGHRATGEIASRYLSNKAKRQIDALLNGQSLAMVSTYADEIKSDDRYQEFGPWHYVNFPFDSNYEAHPKSEKGDIYVAINRCISILKDTKSSETDRVFYLKMLVHFIGDLHQPLHIGIEDDRGGNRFQVQWFDEGTNLHTVWDSEIIETYNMSYTELAENCERLSKEEIKEIQAGTVRDWMYESRELCLEVYKNTKSGENLKYRYMYEYSGIVRSQLQKGGIRLAKILNEIFG
jgi:hypothetical protein